MATSGRQFCDICISQHITTPANVWCPECEENFCDKCKIHHDVAKATKKHETIGIENILKLPKFVQEIKTNCVEHDERFVLFCGDHEVPCCAECLYNTHKSCRKLTPVKNIVKNIKDSSAFVDLEVSLADLLANIEKYIDDRSANLQELVKQKAQCEEEIKTARETINSYIDSLERDLTNKLHQAFVAKDRQIRQVLTDLEARKITVDEMQENVNSIKTIASNFQTFIAIRELEQWAHKKETDLQHLFENESFNWTEVSVVLINIQSIKNSFTTIDNIDGKQLPTKTLLKVRKTREAQLMGAGCISAKIDMIILKEKIKVDLPKKDKNHEILDCGIFNNGDLLFSDRKKQMLIDALS
ncbi:nuclear factor 7, brain-like [Mytilus californianus]|uniref:nuclear factor 7, brain-like n=1 Tax=Mytilus californianus TaxID=6549 RepID=UPI0022454B33|nr:nuclear factor 7, brain-like [Mytilus californianus]